MSQDDERIARKLLDVGARSDRVQVRDGITYFDGFALGNGTVEIRSQVVRDRRRRYAPDDVSYAAAILYEVVNGTNSEIWLQDDGAEPVLITTLPQRIALNWSAVVANRSIVRLGYLLRQPLFFSVGLSPQVTFNQTGTNPSPTNIRVSFSSTGAFLEWGDGSGILRTGDVGTFWLIYQTSGSSTEVRANGLFSNGTTVTIQSLANHANAHIQRRKNRTYVYIRHQYYHSLTTPAPSIETGNVWMEAQYWANGTLSTGTVTPDPFDITGSVLNNALQHRLTVTDPESPLNGVVFTANSNFYSSTERVSLIGSQDSFLPTEANQGTAEVDISVSKNGGTPVISTQQFPCAPANARQILSVAVYPRG